MLINELQRGTTLTLLSLPTPPIPGLPTTSQRLQAKNFFFFLTLALTFCFENIFYHPLPKPLSSGLINIIIYMV